MKLTQSMFDQLMEIIVAHQKTQINTKTLPKDYRRLFRIKAWLRHQLLKQAEEKND